MTHLFATIGRRKPQDDLSFSLPSSKSISNRLLIIRFLADSELKISNLSSSDDTFLLKRHLAEIKRRIILIKRRFIPTKRRMVSSIRRDSFVELDCKNAGTTCRFLIALLSTTYGKWLIRADERMEHRPLMPLTDVLKRLGADIEIAGSGRIFPLKISGKPLSGGDCITLPANYSSQFVSALAMIAPYTQKGLSISLSDAQVSKPYIDMTLSLMRDCGAEMSLSDNNLQISPVGYKFKDFEVEADWSAAAFAYALVALLKLPSLKIKGLRAKSLQGDAVVRVFFEQFFGVKTLFADDYALLSYSKASRENNNVATIDFKSCPDLFLPLVVTAVCLRQPFEYKGLDTLVHKESDRLGNIVAELKKIGFKLYSDASSLAIYEYETSLFDNKKVLETDSYNDHRFAMAMSLFASVYEKVIIKNPDCVEKSFPNYWEELSKFFYLSLS